MYAPRGVPPLEDARVLLLLLLLLMPPAPAKASKNTAVVGLITWALYPTLAKMTCRMEGVVHLRAAAAAAAAASAFYPPG